MIRIDLLVFDLDGTLVDSRTDIVNAVNFMLNSLGLKEKNYDRVVSYIGTGEKDLIRQSLQDEDEGLLERGLSIFKDYYRNHSADSSKLYPGVKETIEYYKHKTMIVVTNRTAPNAESTLSILGIDKYFEDLIGGNEDSCLKPSACPLERIPRRLIRSKDRCMVIGDMAIDIEAGRSAGFITCGVTYGIGKGEDIEKAMPDYVMDRIDELKEIVARD